MLTGRHAGAELGEVKFFIDEFSTGRKKPTRRRFRAIGIFRPEERVFIFLVGCEESGVGYIPADAFEDAMKHKAALDRGHGVTDEHI